ncbi:MAG TPA: hypothetical protein VNZ86_19910, partial [Bacteroidia bacterium]|nr:hypothetical protein [Bacteroidia bacterium]
MKFRISLFCITAAFFLSSAHAQQWEQVGWKGGAISVTKQLGNTLYGQYGNGVYRSKDWGKTWSLFRNGLPQDFHFYSYVYFNVQNEYLYVLDPYKPIVYYCKENDNDWSSKEYSLISGVSPDILYWSPDTVLAILIPGSHSFYTDSGFYLSVDGGLSWNSRSASPFGFIQQYCQGRNNTGFAEFGAYDTVTKINSYHLYRTDDLGLTWKELALPFSDTDYFTISYLSGDNLLLYTGGKYQYIDLSVYSSSDNGSHWSQITTMTYDPRGVINNVKQIGSRSFIIFSPINLFNTYVLYQSLDSGTHWSMVQGPSQFISIADLFGNDNMLFQHVYDQDADQYVRYDSLYNIADSFSVSQGIVANAVVYASGKTLVSLNVPNEATDPAANFCDTLMISTDNGDTWAVQAFSDTYSMNEVPWMKDGGILYAAGIEKKTNISCMLRSSDEGNSWTRVCALDSTRIITGFFVRNDTIIVKEGYSNVGDPAMIYSTIDGGHSWVAWVPPYDLDLWNCFRLEVLTNNFYMYSPDLGSQWDSISYAPVQKFFDYSPVFIIGSTWYFSAATSITGYHLYYSVDSGANFIMEKGLDSTNNYYTPVFKDGILYLPASNNLDGSSKLYVSSDTGKSW